MVLEMNNENKEIWICTGELFSPGEMVTQAGYCEKKRKKHNKKKFYLIPVVVFFIVGTMFRTDVQEYKETVYYMVTEGDTLWDISRRFLGRGYKYLKIALDNDIANPDLIYPGEEYRINITHKYYWGE